jgi:AraC-like DNA-binding protein
LIREDSPPLQPLLLQNFPVVATHDPEELRHALIRTYNVREFATQARTPFAAHVNQAKFGDVGLSFCTYAAPVTINAAAASYVRHVLVRSGHGRVRFGSRSVDLAPGVPCTIPADHMPDSEFDAGYGQLTLRIEASALNTKLGALLGYPVDGSLEFEPVDGLDNAETMRLHRLLLFFAEESNAVGPTPSDLVIAEMKQSLIVSFLHANRHRYTERLAAREQQLAPWQVQIVESFIEANWDKPLTIEALAEAAGASVRSIFHAFRRSRGYTPMAFAKSVRLREAKRLLEKADPATSVTTIALVCGFQNPGHFAKDYRLAFGERPSHTLARARGLRGQH